MAMKGNLTASETLRAKLAIPNTISGKSAYEIAKMLDPDSPNVVDEQTWIASLKGADGAPGKDGADGKDGAQGIQGEKGEKGDKGDPGEGTTEVVHVSVSHTADGDVYTSDKTVAEILALHDSGKLIAIDLLDSGYHWYFSDGWVAVTSKDPYRGVLQYANHLMYFTAENWQTETDVFKSSMKEDVKITEVSSSNDITDDSPDGFYVVPSKALVSTHTEIDLSKMDAEGLIEEKVTETFDDDTQNVTTKTTRLEFDESGNPIKITDGDGNETVLTW